MRFLLSIVMVLLTGVAWGNRLQFPVELVNKLPPLHRLVYMGQRAEFLRLLPQMKEYLNDKDSEGHTLLHWAIYADDLEFAAELLRHKADPNIYDDYGNTAMHEASRHSSVPMVQLIMDNGGDPAVLGKNETAWNSLFLSALQGKAEVMQTLMQHLDPHSKDEIGRDLFAAAVQGADSDKWKKLELLFEAEVVPDVGLALMAVPLHEMQQLMQLFETYEGLVKFDYRNVNNQNQAGVTPLMRTSLAGSVKAAELLIKHGAFVNIESGQGYNALYSEYRTEGQREVVKLLIANGIEVNNPSGKLAFDAAVLRDDAELAWLILEQLTRGDIDKHPVPGDWFFLKIKDRKPLHAEEEALIAQVLQQVGQNANMLGENEFFHLEVIEEHALDIAKSEEMRHLLRQYGADKANKRQASGNRKSNKPRQGTPDFLINFNQLAKEGKFKPLIGRDAELQQVITTLGRKEKNNPILIGEPGVGKTAVVEGLAQRIVAGDVPDSLRNKTIYTLDMVGLTAGNFHIGLLEKKIDEMLQFITEKSQGRAILFIDEVHQLISKPSIASVADLLKPSMARGLSLIAATTHDEFQKHIMKDSALERRFLPVTIDEPTIDDTITILDGLRAVYERHHQMEITYEAAKGAAKLANQYIANRYNPDKAIDIIDSAASRLILTEPEADKLELKHIAAAVADQTGVPIERMLPNQQSPVEALRQHLKANIFGQDKAIEEFITLLAPTLNGFGNPDKPASVLLLGPPGTGKTELAHVAAEYLFGDREKLIAINLSEYSEKHSIASLIGSPKGYVGYDESGILTEAVRRQPFSVLLLDEIGKAHPEFSNILTKILDKGELMDKKGRTINFRNTIIIITANTLAEEQQRGRIGFVTEDEDEPFDALENSELELPPAIKSRLANRVLSFASLKPAVMDRLIDKQLTRLNTQLETQDITISLTRSVRQAISEEGHKPELGARLLEQVFIDKIDNFVSQQFSLGKMQEGQNYRIGRKKNGNFTLTKIAPPKKEETQAD